MEVPMLTSAILQTKKCVIGCEFSPYEYSSSFLAVVYPESVAVFYVSFDDSGEKEIVHCRHIWECAVTSEVVALAWSPRASAHESPQVLEVAVAMRDQRVVEMANDGGWPHSDQIALITHMGPVNDVAYNSDRGACLASTSDDLTLQVWDRETSSLIAKFLLTSPGMSVRFHPDDPDLVVVAEKCGTVRMYSLEGQCATLSLRCPLGFPLMGADWSLLDASILVGGGGGGLTVWNLVSALPDRQQLLLGGGDKVQHVALCRSNTSLVATLSQPHTLRVTSLHGNKVPVAVPLKVASGLTWHQCRPYLAVGSDRRVLFWKMESI